MTRTILMLAMSMVVGGCLAPNRSPRESTTQGSEEDDGSVIDELGFDPEEVLDLAFNYPSTFNKVNAAPQTGTHGDAATINFYSAPQNEQLFLTIDPTLTDQTVSFIEGAMFLKEHLDPDGAVIGFTVMRKARPGYNPDANDWWWARVSGGSVTHQGQVGFCADCHVMVANTDYVYGIPLDNRG